LDTAVFLFTKAIQIDATFARGYKNLADVHLQKGDLLIAIELFQKAVKFDSTYSGAYENLGNAYTALGNESKAIESYRNAARLGSSAAKTALQKKGYSWQNAN
jgi:tetratricopeptide (TPR) repeat protein